MTKYEKEVLNSQKMQIEKPTEYPFHYIVHMSLTEGELLALQNALKVSKTYAAADVNVSLSAALRRAGIEMP